MAESKMPETKAPATPAKPGLASAAESGDPDVHRLLAERQAHEQNSQPDDPAVAERRQAAKRAIEAIDKQLADMGYSAQ